MSDYMDENEIAIPLAMGMFAEWNDDIDETAWYEIGTKSRLEWISQAHARLTAHDAAIKAEAWDEGVRLCQSRATTVSRDENPQPQVVMADEGYHDNYECAKGVHCVGELRHELLTDPTGAMLPNESPVSFVLWQGGEEYPLYIQAGGVSELAATIDLSLGADGGSGILNDRWLTAHDAAIKAEAGKRALLDAAEAIDIPGRESNGDSFRYEEAKVKRWLRDRAASIGGAE